MEEAATQTGESTLRAWLGSALGILVCNAVGVAGALFTSTDTDWYRNLVKPGFQPPGWVFGPAWTLLYSLMGVAIYRVWSRRDRHGARTALWLFVAQLILNALWSPIFFGANAPGLALAVIVVLVVTVAVTIKHFFSVDRTAGLLLLPYLAWLSFATLLNSAIVVLN